MCKERGNMKKRTIAFPYSRIPHLALELAGFVSQAGHEEA